MQMEVQIAEIDAMIIGKADDHEACQRLMGIPGIGPITGISKRGNGYLRKLLVHGARAVLQCRVKQSPGLRAWLGQLVSRSHPNVVTIALANKTARMAWALLAKGETYRPALMSSIWRRLRRSWSHEFSEPSAIFRPVILYNRGTPQERESYVR